MEKNSDQKTDPEEIRKGVIRAFVYLKRAIRHDFAMMRPYREGIEFHSRKKAKLEAEESPFNHHRIRKASEKLEKNKREYLRIYHDLADYGMLLRDLCMLADVYLSQHDQAQILGINHLMLENFQQAHPKFADEGPEFVPLHDLIIAKVEHRGDSDFITWDEEERMPFWAVTAAVLDKAMSDPDLSQILEEKLDEFFKDMPMYEKVPQADVSSEFERVPPKLKVIEGYADNN